MYYCAGCKRIADVDECPICRSALPEMSTNLVKKRRVKKRPIEGLKLTGTEVKYPTGFNLIIGRDPGESSGTCALLLTSSLLVTRKHGSYSFETPPILWAALKLDLLPLHNNPAVPFSVCERMSIVTEGQWLKGNASKRKGILSLCAASNRWLGRECYRTSSPGYVVPVDVWKGVIFGGEQTDKYVHANWIESALTPEEKRMLPVGPGRHDVLSSIGIAWAAYLLRFSAERFRVI